MLKELKSSFASLPPIVKQFLVKGLIVIVVWQLTYIFLLEPKRLIDIPLTNFVADNTIAVLSQFYKDVSTRPTTRGVEVLIGQRHAIGIADGCNGLALFVVYLGFIICFPIQWKRFLLFAIGGVFVIHILNIARVSGLAWVNLNFSEYMDFAHHYLFKILVYSGIFYLWVLYAKRFLVKTKK